MSTLKLDKTDNYYYHYDNNEQFVHRYTTYSAARYELKKLGLRIKKSSKKIERPFVIWNVVSKTK